jgi:hypothetical protein
MSENTPAVRQLPKYEELINGDIDLKRDQNELNKLLNCPPYEKWVKKHSFAKNVKYIPI